MELIALFYLVDEFCKVFEPECVAHQIADEAKQRNRQGSLSLSEILTICIHFHQVRYRDFKTYYTKHVLRYSRRDFPGLVSYGRFVELMSGVQLPLLGLLTSLLGRGGIANFVDSTTLKVCHNRRIRRHRVFKGLAARDKTSMGWFYGFKLHLIVNESGEIVSFLITPGNTSDNNIPLLEKLSEKLQGKLYGDRGYISKDLFASLLKRGVQLITGIKKRMKNYLMPLWGKLMLRGRSIIETINDQLKNIAQVDHTRHRSPKNFLTNVLSALIAYQLQPKKPKLNLTKTEERLLKQPLLQAGA